MKIKIAPSLMCMDMMNVQEQMAVLGKADYLHVDIIDWHYVKNMCLAPVFVEQLTGITDVPVDVHLMVDNTDEDLVELCIGSGASIITLEPNVVQTRIFRLIGMIKRAGRKAGVFLNPSMPLETVYPYIHLLDMITFMTVDPGYAGQRFVEESLAKVSLAKKLKQTQGYTYEIQVDGSCNKNTYRKIYDAGGEVFVMGFSGLFKNDKNLQKAWDIMIKDIHDGVGP